METFGNETRAWNIKEESYCIAHSFICTEKINNGTFVKLNNDGTVSPLAAGTDKPLGIATVGNKGADERVTVLTPFVIIVNGKASGAVTAGALLEAQPYADGVQTYATGTANPVGVALKSAADGEHTLIGILRIPLATFAPA